MSKTLKINEYSILEVKEECAISLETQPCIYK